MIDCINMSLIQSMARKPCVCRVLHAKSLPKYCKKIVHFLLKTETLKLNWKLILIWSWTVLEPAGQDCICLPHFLKSSPVADFFGPISWHNWSNWLLVKLDYSFICSWNITEFHLNMYLPILSHEEHFQLKSKRKHLLYLFVAKTTPFRKVIRQCLKSFKSWVPFCLSIFYFPPNKFAGQYLRNKWGNFEWDHSDNDSFHYILTLQSFPFFEVQNSIFPQISGCCLLPTFHFSFQKIQFTPILLEREGGKANWGQMPGHPPLSCNFLDFFYKKNYFFFEGRVLAE